jgi:hypothetical protein
MPFVPYTAVSRTTADFLRKFDEAFRGALAIAEPDSLWAAQGGLVLSTEGMLQTTFPIPLSAAGYNEFNGDIKYRTLYELAINVFNDKTWQDGVEELAKIVEGPNFLGWDQESGNMAREWTRLPNTLVAEVLEANPNLEMYRDPDTKVLTARALFAADHPFNVLDSAVGTFDNDIGTTEADILNGTFFSELKSYARSIKGPNGKPMGLRLTGGQILCNGTREELIDEALKQDNVIKVISDAGEITPPTAVGTAVAAAVQRNRHQNIVSYTVADELTDASDDYLYVLLSGNPAAHPWVVMQQSSPEVIICDKDDAKYKEHLKVSFSSHGEAKAAAMMPHRIVRVTIS